MRNSGQAAFKAIIVLATLCLLLAVMAGRLWWQQQQGRLPSDAAIDSGSPPKPTSPRDPAEVLAALVSSGNGLWDSHPDADVARVLQPGLRDRDDFGIKLSSNAFGMRERDYALPKPAGTLRIVLLGDSFVYGMSVPAEQRLGVVLQRALADRLGADAPPIEVLHLGVTSWNLVAECAFVRRQLGLLQPDLVVHFIVPNDLDDTVGVRGMGLLARQVPSRPEQADTVVSMTFGRWALDPQSRGLLPWGMDDESRLRLAEGGDDIRRLAQLVEAQGGRYLLVLNWQAFTAVATQAFASRLRLDQVACIPTSFYRDTRYRISAEDEHWNPGGHELVGQALYAWIAARQLIPSLSLPAWPEADALAQSWADSCEREMQRAEPLVAQQSANEARNAVDVAVLDPITAGQVNGGVFKDGSVSPFASVLLARDGGRTLHVTGQCLSRPELDGVRVEVFVDRQPVGHIALLAGERIDARFPLPQASLVQDWVTVRFIAGDFVYMGADLRQCVAFRLKRAAIDP